MCVEFYELKFIDLIWAYNLKVLMRKTLSRALGGGQGLDEWVVQEPRVGGSHREGVWGARVGLCQGLNSIWGRRRAGQGDTPGRPRCWARVGLPVGTHMHPRRSRTHVCMCVPFARSCPIYPAQCTRRPGRVHAVPCPHAHTLHLPLQNHFSELPAKERSSSQAPHPDRGSKSPVSWTGWRSKGSPKLCHLDKLCWVTGRGGHHCLVGTGLGSGGLRHPV